MDKVKIALTLISIAIIASPLLVELVIYRDNLLGLIIPPQVQSLMNGGKGNGSNGSQSQPLSGISNFQVPQPVGQLQYNPTTGAFVLPFNFTNPLTTQISINQLSADITSAQNNAALGTVSINGPITLNPDQNAIINVTGTLSPQEVSQLQTQYQQNGSLPISLANLNVDVGGVKIHLDQLSDIGSIPIPGGT